MLFLPPPLYDTFYFQFFCSLILSILFLSFCLFDFLPCQVKFAQEPGERNGMHHLGPPFDRQSHHWGMAKLAPYLLTYLLSYPFLLLAHSPDLLLPTPPLSERYSFAWLLVFFERLGDEYFSWWYVQPMLLYGTGIISF